MDFRGNFGMKELEESKEEDSGEFIRQDSPEKEIESENESLFEEN